MSHYSVKVDLAKLNHVVRELPKKGGGTTKVIILDGPSNHLFFSEKGAVYLDLVAFENKEIKFENTHSIKQSLSKEIRDKMTEDQVKNMPFLGNMKPIRGGSNNQNTQTSGKVDTSFGTVPDFGSPDLPAANTSDPLDDLPF